MSYFVENWSSLENLLEHSCHIAGLACQIRLVMGGGGWEGRVDRSLYKITVASAARLLQDRLCDAIRPNTQVTKNYTTLYQYHLWDCSQNFIKWWLKYFWKFIEKVNPYSFWFKEADCIYLFNLRCLICSVVLSTSATQITWLCDSVMGPACKLQLSQMESLLMLY